MEKTTLSAKKAARTASTGARNGSKAKSAPDKKPAKRVAKKQTVTIGSFQDLIETEPRKTQAIARRLRAIVRDVLPRAEETVYTGWKIASYRDRFEICGIQPDGDRCKFYLTHGAELADPEGLLEGTGKSIRHVEVSSIETIPVTGIKQLIRQGRKRTRL